MGCGNQSAFATRVIAFVGFVVLAASPAAAQFVPLPACPVPDKSRLVEWDVEIAKDGAGSADTESGTLVVDPQSSRRSRVLFVTKVGFSARLYRFTPGLNMKKDAAEAKSWDLGSFLTGGIRLRPSKDGPVFINTVLLESAFGGVVAVDPNSNTRTIWSDRPTPVTLQSSDIEVDKRGSGFGVFTAAPEYNPVVPNGTPLTGGVVQRLRPGKPGAMNSDGTVNVPAEVTRWRVGGGAGTCEEGVRNATAPCIPGVAVDRYGKVFVSEPEFARYGGVGAIGELDTALTACPYNPAKQCSVVRHWPTPAMTTGPRELMVDSDGVVWGITTSGEVFSLRIDRYSNKASVTRHNPVIGQGVEYMFAVAPDGGAVGFTDANVNKVSLLFPKNNAKPVTAVIEYVPAETGTIVGIRENVYPSIHLVTPTVAKADTFVYTQDDGSYRETDIATGMTADMTPTPTGSFSPTGMAPDISRRTGSFYYGVGFRGDGVPSHRVGQLLVNIEPERELRERRDDDDFDHDGIDNAHDNDDDDDGIPDLNDDDDDNDCIPDLMDHDKDNDGIDDDDDTNDRETVKRDSGTLAPGQVVRYDMESDANSRALIAVVEAADLTAPFVIDVVNPAGVVVLSVPSIGGKAIATATPVLSGFYTIQVRNTGIKSTAYTTKIIGRSIWF
jgi:hypothetical protein